MASVSVLSAPRTSLSALLDHHDEPEPVGFQQAENSTAMQGSEFCNIDPNQRYTLETYQPSQLQDSPDSFGKLMPDLPTSEQLATYTQGYSSGYMTGSSGPKTPDIYSKMSTKTCQNGKKDRVQEDDRVWQDIPQTCDEDTNPYSTINPHPRTELSYDDSQGALPRSPVQHSTPFENEPYFQHSHPRTQLDFGDHSSLRNTQPPCYKPRRTRPLLTILRRLKDLDVDTRQQLKNADEHLRKGKLDKAIQYLEGSLLQTNNYPRLQMAIWMLLGSTQMQLSQYKKASVCHLHYLAFCREMEDFHGMTKAECNLGIAYMKLGLLKLAGRCFLQYLDNCRVLRDDVGIGAACSNLGMLSKSLALRGYQAALTERDREKANEFLSTNLNRSIAYFEQHLDIMEQYGDLEKQARAYGNLGSCYELLKQYSQAIFCHNKRLEIARTIGDKVSECCSLCNLGNCFRATGKLQEAMEYYHLGLELSQVTRNFPVEMVSLLNLGITCELMNKLDKAIEWHTLYLSMAVQMNDLKSQARGFSTMAGLYEEMCQMRKAHEYYQKLVEIFKKLGEKDAETSAASYLKTVRRNLKEEKKRNKKSSRGTLRKRFKNTFRPHTVSRSSGLKTCSPRANTSSIIPSQHQLERSGSTRNKMGTWSTARGKQYLSQQKETVSNSESFSSMLVFENPATAFLQDQYKYQAEVAARVADQTHLYDRAAQAHDTSPTDSSLSFPYAHQPGQFQGIGPAGLDNEEESYPFYSLGNVIQTRRSPSSTLPSSHPSHLPPPPPREFAENEFFVDVHHNPDAESTTDYESISENIPTRLPRQDSNPTPESAPTAGANHRMSVCSTSTCTYTSSQIWGSERHVEEIQRLQEDFSQTSGPSELGLDEGVDKEWEQWLNLHDVNALSRVVSVNMGQIGNRSKSAVRRRDADSLKATLSAPTFDLYQDQDDDTSSTYTDSSLPL